MANVRFEEIKTRSGFSFRARRAGPVGGRPVVLLHGFPETSACWAAQLPVLAEAGRAVVAFDQRGYSPGARPEAVSAYKPAELVSDVLDVADALGWERFDLVSHDFGGMVAWMVAGHHPDRIETLTVASTPHPVAYRDSYADESSDQHERSGYFRGFRAAGRGEVEAAMLADDAAGLRRLYRGLPESSVSEYVNVLSQPGAMRSALDWYRAMSGRASAATPPSPVPTLYVWSDRDPSVAEGPARATAAQVSGPYRFEVIPGAGHWIPELAADRFNPILLEHLASSPGRRGHQIA